MYPEGSEMFGFFKKKQADSPEGKLGPGDPIISALLLEGESFPVDAFLAEVAKTPIAGKTASGIKRDGVVFSFSLGDEFLALAEMPAPWPDLEGPLATSWMWPRQQPIENIKRHRSHVLVTANGVMAVYWPEATLVHFPPVFVQMTETIDSPEAPPLYLWVDLRAFRNEDGTTGLFTTGLSELGHMEIEIPRIDMEPGELREWLLNIMYYLLEKGPVLQHGQTIGMTAEQQFRIRHCPSKFGHPGTVICLEP
jgi:hypothetical protein